jgi:hypothetical protein
MKIRGIASDFFFCRICGIHLWTNNNCHHLPFYVKHPETTEMYFMLGIRHRIENIEKRKWTPCTTRLYNSKCEIKKVYPVWNCLSFTFRNCFMSTSLVVIFLNEKKKYTSHKTWLDIITNLSNDPKRRYTSLKRKKKLNIRFKGKGEAYVYDSIHSLLINIVFTVIHDGLGLKQHWGC